MELLGHQLRPRHVVGGARVQALHAGGAVLGAGARVAWQLTHVSVTDVCAEILFIINRRNDIRGIKSYKRRDLKPASLHLLTTSYKYRI